MNARKIWQAARDDREVREIDGVSLAAEVVAALRSLKPIEVDGETLFAIGPSQRCRLVERDGQAALERVGS